MEKRLFLFVGVSYSTRKHEIVYEFVTADNPMEAKAIAASKMAEFKWEHTGYIAVEITESVLERLAERMGKVVRDKEEERLGVIEKVFRWAKQRSKE